MSDPIALTAALNAIADPLTGRGLIEGGRAAAPRVSDGVASVILDVTGLSGDARLKVEAAIKQGLSAVEGIQSVRVAMTVEKTNRRILAVASGKGGVGKSTVATNLAVALKRTGFKVGLVDADIYGPSQPRLMGVEGVKPTAKDDKLQPVPTPYGVPILSMGQMIDAGKAIAWRGPMASNALSQLMDADWGDADLLILDMPPGTGDIQLTMVQKFRPVGAVIVSTPQDLALIDARRAIDLFRLSGIPIIGLIENMAGYACPHCGEVSDPFGTGGAEAAAQSMDLPFLGRVPLEISIRRDSDAGRPPAQEKGSAFDGLADKVAAWLNSPPD